MIKVQTNKSIASDSLDHLYPFGVVRDNNSNIKYIREVKKYFNNEKIAVMDLGCAGGQIIVDHHLLGDTSVGLEGSSNVFRGAGKHNWEILFNQNLFLCDITEPYSIDDEAEQMMFDYIQMWEVLEHIPEEKLTMLFTNIKKHLKDTGIFCGSIATHVCPSGTHVSIFPKTKWITLFKDNGLELSEYIFEHLPRPVSEGDLGFVFTARLIK
jgi:2-polyprenyl-3-methyl-5-hydroxy-6-metoxy-1,4-benzoquinol methylase